METQVFQMNLLLSSSVYSPLRLRTTQGMYSYTCEVNQKANFVTNDEIDVCVGINFKGCSCLTFIHRGMLLQRSDADSR